MTILPETIRALPRFGRVARPALRLPPWTVSWLQVSPLAFVLVVLFALPTVLFFVVSFFDYDRTGIYPAFILSRRTPSSESPSSTSPGIRPCTRSRI